MAKSRAVDSAKKQKRDEFYTLMPDIENEMRHYKQHFKGKTVYCNCDDPYESNFFKYFATNFDALRLKRLIATSYAGSPIVGERLPLKDIEGLKPAGKEPYMIDIRDIPDHNGKGAVDFSDVDYLLRNDANTVSVLNGGGSFESKECIALLEESDIVATNPPFSLIRKYIATLMEHEKKFVILAPKNASGYKDIFPFFMQNRIWYGHNDTTQRYFRVPAHYEFASEDTVKFDEDGNKLASSDALWFTNLETDKRYKDLLLFKNYTPEEYPKFENLDGINVDETKNIPLDYYGLMGVPISFLQKYNPNQFEIVGFRKGTDGRDLRIAGTNKIPYLRVIIKRKEKQP